MFKPIIFIFCLVLLYSCNPVKRVLNNNKNFEIVAKEVVKRGYCINDTVIIDSSKIDTVYKENYIVDTFKISKEFNIDTVLNSGARVTIIDGVLSVKCPSSKVITKTVNKTGYIRDLKLENILKNESNLKTDSINQLKLSIKDQNITIKELKSKIVKEKAKFWILISSLILLLVIYLLLKFKPL